MDGTKASIGTIAGVVIALAALVLVDTSDPEQAGAPTSESAATTSTVPPSPWFSPNEIVFESTVLIPTDVAVDEGTVTLAFDLESLAPSSGTSDEEPTVDALPERWGISTVSGGGTIVEIDPGATSVSFRLRSGIVLEHIESVDLIGWRTAVPVAERVVLELEPGAAATFAGGTTATIGRILEQTNSTVVQIAVDQPHSKWDRIGIDATDPGWRESGRSGGGVQYTWDRSEAPATIELVQSTPTWVPVDGVLAAHRRDES